MIASTPPAEAASAAAPDPLATTTTFGITIPAKHRSTLDVLLLYPLCPWCILRFLNVRSSSAMQHSGAQLATVIQSAFAPPSLCRRYTPPAHCAGCADILPSLSSRVQSLLSSADYRDHQYRHFTLWLSLPPLLTLRQRVFHHVLNGLPSVDLKECVKWVASHEIISRSDIEKSYQPNSQLCSFAIKIDFSLSATDRERELMEKFLVANSFMTGSTSKRLKERSSVDTAITQSNLQQVLAKLSADDASPFADYYRLSNGQLPSASVSMDYHRDPVLLMGNYLKFSRDLSQTPWELDDDEADTDTHTNTDSAGSVKRRTVSSVEEEICRHVLPVYQPRECRFSASGREDVNVRMLGNGRTFCLELIDCKTDTDTDTSTDTVTAIQRAINTSTTLIRVVDFHIATVSELKAMKAMIEKKKKRYRCLCYSTSPITAEQLVTLSTTTTTETSISQKTPVRVLHRRSQLVRKKSVFSLQFIFMTDHYFTVDLVTSAGTYVKEFVHGDRGRTEPSVSSMLGSLCECVLLDVTGLVHE